MRHAQKSALAGLSLDAADKLFISMQIHNL